MSREKYPRPLIAVQVFEIVTGLLIPGEHKRILSFPEKNKGKSKDSDD